MAKTAKTTASKTKTLAAEPKAAKVSAPAEKKAEEKTTAKTTAVKAAAPVKTASKSTAKTAEKASAAIKDINAEKADVKPEVFVEFGNAQVSIEKVAEDAKKKYAADGNKDEIKSLKIYLKPEEQLAYYVINDTVSDKMDVFFY